MLRILLLAPIGLARAAKAGLLRCEKFARRHLAVFDVVDGGAYSLSWSN